MSQLGNTSDSHDVELINIPNFACKMLVAAFAVAVLMVGITLAYTNLMMAFGAYLIALAGLAYAVDNRSR